MKQYYYLNNNQQVGPFNADQLRIQPIGPDTLVWAQGMTNWTRAADVPEVSSLMNFGGQPGPFTQPATDGNMPQQPVYTNPQPQPPTYGYQPPAYQQPQYGQQPQYAYNTPSMPMPKTWLVESILVTLFCCLPLGIVGIISASRVESRYRVGDVAGAQQASEEAGRWTKIGLFVGIGFVVLYALLVAGGIVAGIANT